MTASRLARLRVVLPLLAALPNLALGEAPVLYPTPAGIQPSPHFEILVEIDGRWEPTFVNFDPARTSGSGSGDEAGRSFSWTTFEAGRPVRVRVRRLEGDGGEVTLRPRRPGRVARSIEPGTVEFSMTPGLKISVEFEADIKTSCFTGPPHGIPCVKRALAVFCDPLRDVSALADIPREEILVVEPGLHRELVPLGDEAVGQTAGRSTLGNCEGKRVVVFSPGVHEIGYWQVPNSIDHVHLEGGAVVFGALDVIPQGREPFHDAATILRVYRDGWRQETLRPGFSLTGPGILSGARLPWHLKKDFTVTRRDDWWAHVKLVQLAAERVRVEDITLVNSPHWVLSFINDADSRTRGTFENFKMLGAWTYNNDGLPNPSGPGSHIRDAFIHADDDAFKLYNGGSTIENCVVWQANNGAVFQLGWFPKTVGGIRIRDIDVIHFENWYGVGQVNRAVFNYANAGGPGLIEDIEFHDIRIEGPVLRLFGFQATGGQVIRDLSFHRLSVPGGMGVGRLGSPGANYFIGEITGFTFHDFTLGGTRVASPGDARFEFGTGAGGGFTFTASGAPVVRAGPDLEISLPRTSITLRGAAVDHDGRIVELLWHQLSGPREARLVGRESETLDVSDLVEGTYEFRLTATDDDGESDRDDVLVHVLPEPPPAPPVARAGPDRDLVLPENSILLEGSGTDVGGEIVTLAWARVSGPSDVSLDPSGTGAVKVTGLTEGAHVFRLTVTDDDGMTGQDDVTVTVHPEGTIPGRQVLWNRGAKTSRLATAENWEGRVAPGPTDIAVLRAPDLLDGSCDLESDRLTWGALKVNEYQTGFWNLASREAGARGSLTLLGQDVGPFEHAAIVNLSGQGGGIRADVILQGGGSFVIAHGAGSGLEIDGILGEQGGSASLVIDGLGRPGTGQARVHIRGRNASARPFRLTGSVILRNGANLRVEGGLDVASTGGTLSIDARSRLNLSPVAVFRFARAEIRGQELPPGSYTREALAEIGLGESFEGSGGTLVVDLEVGERTSFNRGSVQQDGHVDPSDPAALLETGFSPAGWLPAAATVDEVERTTASPSHRAIRPPHAGDPDPIHGRVLSREPTGRSGSRG